MSVVTFGINGFGRIGRASLRAWWQFHRQEAELKVINTSGSMEIEDWAHLLEYDSNYGRLDATITTTKQRSKDEVSDEEPVLGELKIDDHSIVVTAQREPAKIPWNEYGVKTVLEATGVFTTADKANNHLKGGGQKVLISAPAKGGDVSISVLGVNDFDPQNPIRSNASCTTNCITPVAQVMVESLGVLKATLTTIHAYTDGQNLLDNSHKDLRRARAAALNMVPTSTGAALATTKIIPQLEGIFDGLSVRVPIAVGSLSDMVFVTKKDTTVQEINQILTQASQQAKWQNILAVTDKPLVSSDIVGRRESSIVDLSFTQVVGGNLVKIISWYDNEWGYCNRLIEQIAKDV